MPDFFLFIYFFFSCIRYFAENRQNLCLTVEIWASLVADTFINEQFFYTNTLLFRRKSAKFATNYQNINFSRGWYIYNSAIFCANTLLSCRKSAKFTTNCQNVNFSRGWYFYKYAIFLHKYSVILPESAKFVTKSDSKSFKKIKNSGIPEKW